MLPLVSAMLGLGLVVIFSAPMMVMPLLSLQALYLAFELLFSVALLGEFLLQLVLIGVSSLWISPLLIPALIVGVALLVLGILIVLIALIIAVLLTGIRGVHALVMMVEHMLGYQAGEGYACAYKKWVTEDLP